VPPPSAAAATAFDGRADDDSIRSGIAPVSVVIPCYRCEHTIGPAVASVAAQTLRPAEVLLVDDGSGDGTLQQLEAIANHFPSGWIKVIALPHNAGPSAARNRGWDRAQQPWVAFLDADDTWHPQKLQWQMEAVAKDPQIAMVSHPMDVQPRSASPSPLRSPPKAHIVARHLVMLRNPFPTASLVLRRDLPFRFDESRRRAEDFLLWAQILLSGYRCAKLDQVLASYHKPPFGAGGLSGDMDAMYLAAIDVRRHLHQLGLLGWWQWQLVEAMAWLRHLRRHVLTATRRKANNPPATAFEHRT
jgi:glycosyltransferase involved in cell wall biosynthesis